MAFVVSLLLLISFCHGAHGALWASTSPPDGQTLYACSSDTVTFAWQFLLNATDTAGDKEWFYDGRSQEMVAMSSHGNFFPTPAFSQRVEAVGNAGITIRKVVVGDAGNYSVEVHVYGDSGSSHILLRRTVVLHVSEHLMTTDGELHVIQSSDAVLDPNSNEWSIQLLCGRFTFAENPPFQVEWITPSGERVNSTDFINGQFALLLRNPVQGGNYTCRIPTQLADRACLHGNNDHQGQATVIVDKVEARLSLLEKENEQLKQQLTHTNTELSNTKNELTNELTNTKTDLKAELSEVNSTLNRDLTQEAQLRKQADSDQQARLQKLEDAARHRVAFHATGLQSETPSSGTPLVFTTVHYNEGNAYSSSTGYFVVPADGIYYFISSTGSNIVNSGAGLYLCVDYTQIDVSYSYTQVVNEMSSVHGVVHLRVGQRVWIRSDGNTYRAYISSFTGFLLSRDI